jgi:GNAT superfamily N-acetyltransferase
MICFRKTSDKEKLYAYVNEHITDPILLTFLTLWEDRGYWEKFEPTIIEKDGKIIGFVAYTIDEKYKDKLKVYYLHVCDSHRGKGLGKELLELCYQEAKFNNVNFYFVSEENSDGYKLFKDKFEYKKELNEFNTYDYIFDIETKKQTLWG